MIRNLFHHLMDYMEIHPLRFWGFIVGFVLLFGLSMYFLNKMFEKFKNKNPKKVKGTKNESKAFFIKYKVLLATVFAQLFIIIGLLALLSTNFSPVNYRMENPSISSSKYIFGIDVSHYQGQINWTELQTSHHPIEYIFIRATMGVDGKDVTFNDNWIKAKQHNYIRGAYHYYRPNENSTQQFQNFSSSVNLVKGDFIPILDIEKESQFGMDNLRAGVLNWLALAEAKYGVKPMVYTGLKFYEDNLKGYIDDYPLWIAAYSGKHKVNKVDWHFHQFTEKAIVKGIKTTVDANDFNGSAEDLKKLLIP